MGRRVSLFALAPFLAILALTAFAESPQVAERTSPPTNKPVRIASINAKLIFDEILKADLKQLAKEVKEYQKLREAKQSELAFHDSSIVDNSSERKKFIQREVAIYASGYREIEQEVARYCEAEGIDLVLSDYYCADKATSDNHDTVERNIAERILYTNRDITPEILWRLKQRYEEKTNRPRVSEDPDSTRS